MDDVEDRVLSRGDAILLHLVCCASLKKISRNLVNLLKSPCPFSTPSLFTFIPLFIMSFFDPQKQLTPEERDLSFEQFREMIRIAKISIATAAPIFGVSDRTLKRYANDRHSCIDETYFAEIVRLFRGLENYKRLFKQTANEQGRDYICAWRAVRSGIIYFDEFTIFGYSGALDRFRDLEARARAGEGGAKYRILLTDGHRRFIFRILKNELVPV
ncbi:MAG: hypothetical protein H9535_12790 [Ignavibacteria bacterium]|nr:hypothetical protein [Ignavibacteria bacterium]